MEKHIQWSPSGETSIIYTTVWGWCDELLSNDCWSQRWSLSLYHILLTARLKTVNDCTFWWHNMLCPLVLDDPPPRASTFLLANTVTPHTFNVHAMDREVKTGWLNADFFNLTKISRLCVKGYFSWFHIGHATCCQNYLKLTSTCLPSSSGSTIRWWHLLISRVMWGTECGWGIKEQKTDERMKEENDFCFATHQIKLLYVVGHNQMHR